ncbi:MAG: CotH kinase family protein [Myxococcota bacterium]
MGIAMAVGLGVALALAGSGCRDPEEPPPAGPTSDLDPVGTTPPPPSSTPTTPPETTDPTDAAFDPTRVIEVALTLDPDDWAALRAQANDPLALLGGDCMSGPKQTVFTPFEAALTVDGQAFDRVSVRKKGFLGSGSAARPSLKVHLDAYPDPAGGPDPSWNGVDELTLNNDAQDESRIRTCLAYQVFAGAGIPAPRCNFARVVVNGEDLGVYTNVEEVGPAMLGRWFADPTGHLYEGQNSDLRAPFVDTYELKGAAGGDRADLAAAAAAIAVDDPALVASVEPVIDLDAFYRFWAAEQLVAHWDGWTNGLNNHFLYHDPETGRFHPIPWGADYTFHATDLYLGPDRPASVSANAILAHRLYGLADQRARYAAAMEDLLATGWDEAALDAEIDRMVALLAPVADPLDGRWDAEVAATRAFVDTRRAAIEAELAVGPADWPYPLGEATCRADGGPVSGTFTTRWGTNVDGDPFATGRSTIDVDAPGVLVGSSFAGGASAGDDPASGFGYRHTLQLLTVFPDGSLQLLYALVAPDAFAPGLAAPLDWQSVFALLGEVDPATGSLAQAGYVGSGTMTFDAASVVDGETVSGTFAGRLLVSVPAD